jgi:phospholipid/cholesterol/gamma-HCH transport system substrate-binding protein
MTVHNVYGKILGVLVFVAVFLVLFIGLYKGAGGTVGRLSSPYTANVILPDGFQLVENADVRAAGVKIGRVASIMNRGAHAVVKVEIDKDHAPLHRDATTLLRTKTLVGENFLEVVPGNQAQGDLPDGGTIPVDRAGESVQLDEILSSLDERTRAGIQRTISGLGTGVAGRATDINRLFAAMPPTVVSGATVMGLLDRQRDEFGALIDDTGQVMQAIASRGTSLRSLVTSAKSTAEVVATRDRALGSIFKELPSTLQQTRTSVTRLQEFSRVSTPVVADMTVGFRELQPVVRDLPAAADFTRQAMLRLAPFIKVVDPLLDELKPFANATKDAIPGLDAVLRQADPLVSFLSPYDRDLASFFANQAGMTSYKDANGHGVRLLLHIDPNGYAGFSPQMRQALDRLGEAGSVAIDAVRVQKNPYPAPGTIGKNVPFRGDYQRVEPRK